MTDQLIKGRFDIFDADKRPPFYVKTNTKPGMIFINMTNNFRIGNDYWITLTENINRKRLTCLDYFFLNKNSSEMKFV